MERVSILLARLLTCPRLVREALITAPQLLEAAELCAPRRAVGNAVWPMRKQGEPVLSRNPDSVVSDICASLSTAVLGLATGQGTTIPRVFAGAAGSVQWSPLAGFFNGARRPLGYAGSVMLHPIVLPLSACLRELSQCNTRKSMARRLPRFANAS